MDYIRSSRAPKGCIFCDADDSESDRERLILHRGEHVSVRLNRFPYAAGHLLVSPLVHSARLHELAPAVAQELMARVADCTRVLESTYDCDGMNVGANLGRAAGAGFADHLHFHLVPRWEGDVNFITALGETRVIPQHLERTYDELLPQFQELARQ